MPKADAKAPKAEKAEKAEKPVKTKKAKKDPSEPKKGLSAYMYVNQLYFVPLVTSASQ